MKLKKAMMSLAAATAAGLCISAYAANPEKGQSGTLNLTDPVTNATAAASDSALTTFGGNWINTPPTAEGNYIVIDVTNEFAVTTPTTDPIVQCDFELQVAPVPASLRPDSAPGAQTAFCVCVDDTDTNFWAYVNNGVSNVWKKLVGLAVPATETDYSLRVTFDYKNTTKYVKFSVKTEGSTYTDLHEYGESTIWFRTAAQSQSGVSQYCFVGSGNVKSFAMAQSAVEAESVDVGGKDVAVPEAQVAAVEAMVTGGETVAEVLAAQATTKFPELTVEGVTVADAIALGLIAPKDDGTKMEVKKTSVKVAGNALAASSDIAINVNVAKPEGSNATIKYTLRGSTDGETFSDVDGYKNMDSVPTIPTSLIGTGDCKYLFFKVKVSVEYPTVNQ